MLIKKPDDIKSSEITPQGLYLNRRTFMRGVVLAASTTATGLLYRSFTRTNEKGELAEPAGEKIADVQSAPAIANSMRSDSLENYSLQQLLRVFDRQTRGGRQSKGIHNPPVDGLG